MAEAEMKSIASIRLQEKYNCVRAYESIGAPMEEFCKDWTKTTGKMLNVKLKKDKLSKWVQASRFEDWAGFVQHAELADLLKAKRAPKI